MKKLHLLIAGIVGAAVIAGLAAVIFLHPAEGTWEATKPDVYPQFVRSDHKNQAPIVTRPFSDEIDIAYVIDKGDKYDFIMKPQMRDWAVSDAQIHIAAMENLETLADETEMQLSIAEKVEKGKYIIVETGDGYDAARLLSERARKVVAKELGDTYFAAIPVRDFLIFWMEGFPLQNQFISQIQTEFDNGGTYRLSPNPYRITPEGIQPLKAQPQAK